MEFSISDFNDNPTTIDTGDKEIKGIQVKIISGDEVIVIHFEDVTIETYDSSNCRIMNFYDSEYFVPKKLIQKWIDLQDKYDRCDFFYELQRKDIEQWIKNYI